jgi:ribosomal protein L11 methylase PrmA
LVLAGILDHQAHEITQTAHANGLGLLEKKQIEDWVSLSFIKE